MHCEWPTCKKESFLNTEHFTQHLHYHRDKARDNFAVSGICQWPGCRSRKSGVTFKTVADFNQHLKRHMKYYWCNIAGCKHGEGFARQHDLTRHLKTHSEEHEFKCPDSSCTSSSIGFPRKDKLDDHIKTRHPHLINDVQSRRCNVHGCTTKKPFDTIEDLKAHFVTSHEDSRPHRCPVKSCARHSNGFTTWGKLVEHSKVEHNPPKCKFDHCDFRSFLGEVMVEHARRDHRGPWECNLPGCEGSRSAFYPYELLAHLLNHHDIRGETCQYAPLQAARVGDMSYFNDRTFVPCKYCSALRTGCCQNEVPTNDGE